MISVTYDPVRSLPRPWRLDIATLSLALVAAVSSIDAKAFGRGAEPHKVPNIVVILADDQGWGDLSVHGNTNLQTPNIDSLARDGALFERFYVCPLCAPTRAEFLTGRYHSRGGVHGVTTGAERLNLDEKTIADTLPRRGLRDRRLRQVAQRQPVSLPSQRPRLSTNSTASRSGHWGQYFDPILEHNGQLVRGQGFIIDDLTDHALAFIEQNRSRPFFCYVPYNTPHSPFQVPDRFYDKFKDATSRCGPRSRGRRNSTRPAARWPCARTSTGTSGGILGKLDELQLSRNTIVLYFSDNGPNCWRWNGGMKGRKGSTDEGGVRVPCLVRWPGRIRPGTRIPQIAGAIDLLPTLASLAGIPVVGSQAARRPEPQAAAAGHRRGLARPHDLLVSERQGQRPHPAVSPGRQRRPVRHDGRPRTGPRRGPEAARGRGAADASRGRVAAGRCCRRTRTTGRSRSATRSFPPTPLPARDGVAAGQIRRSATAPNCSYFTNWRTTEDKITWDIEVATGGEYEAVIYYTCPAADVGSTVELSFGGGADAGPGRAGVRSAADRQHGPGAAAGRIVRQGLSSAALWVSFIWNQAAAR